jgi:hypothetical protein
MHIYILILLLLFIDVGAFTLNLFISIINHLELFQNYFTIRYTLILVKTYMSHF